MKLILKNSNLVFAQNKAEYTYLYSSGSGYVNLGTDFQNGQIIHITGEIIEATGSTVSTRNVVLGAGCSEIIETGSEHVSIFIGSFNEISTSVGTTFEFIREIVNLGTLDESGKTVDSLILCLAFNSSDSGIYRIKYGYYVVE